MNKTKEYMEVLERWNKVCDEIIESDYNFSLCFRAQDLKLNIESELGNCRVQLNKFHY